MKTKLSLILIAYILILLAVPISVCVIVIEIINRCSSSKKVIVDTNKEYIEMGSWDDFMKEMDERDNAIGIRKIWNKIENGFYWCLGRWDELTDIPYQIKAFYQRGRRGWADRDCWSLGYYLPSVIQESVDYLRKNNMGGPVAEEEWDKILKDISEGFALVEKEANNEVYSLRDTPKKKRARIIKEVDIVFLTIEEEAKIKLGYKLLQKYMIGLWD